jgi:hypothetical protein
MPVHEPEWKDACAVIGEVTLLYSALDHQLNLIVIEVAHLAPSPMLESVVATLDPRQKIEILKARASHVRQKDWQKGLRTHADRLERVARIRNAVCHTPLVPNKSNGELELAPTAASKLMKGLKIDDNRKYTFDRLTLEQVREIIPVAEKALGGGEAILENFAKVRDALTRKAGLSGGSSS